MRTPPTTPPVYMLNLDRHPDRLLAIGAQLDAQGIRWQRFAAVDAMSAPADALDTYTDAKGPIPRMGKGARACTSGHFLIWKAFLETGAKVAFILEDDIRVSTGFSRFMKEAVLLSDKLDILNFNRQNTRRKAKRLVVRRKLEYKNDLFSAFELLGPHYGTAGYMITRAAAAYLMEKLKRTNVPIDHLLFNPNVSAYSRKARIFQTFPAWVEPDKQRFKTSIQHETVAASVGLRKKLKRGYYEINQAPKLALGLVHGRNQIKTLEYQP